MSHGGSQTINKPQRNSLSDTSIYVSVGQFVYWVALFCAQMGAGPDLLLANLQDKPYEAWLIREHFDVPTPISCVRISRVQFGATVNLPYFIRETPTTFSLRDFLTFRDFHELQHFKASNVLTLPILPRRSGGREEKEKSKIKTKTKQTRKENLSRNTSHG